MFPYSVIVAQGSWPAAAAAKVQLSPAKVDDYSDCLAQRGTKRRQNGLLVFINANVRD